MYRTIQVQCALGGTKLGTGRRALNSNSFDGALLSDVRRRRSTTHDALDWEDSVAIVYFLTTGTLVGLIKDR